VTGSHGVNDAVYDVNKVIAKVGSGSYVFMA